MAELEVQPCESCGTRERHADDLYQRSRPGSKAAALLYRFERLCSNCRKAMPHLIAPQTGGGTWETPPPNVGSS